MTLQKRIQQCPKCSEGRKKKSAPCCSVIEFPSGLSYKCFHCGYKEFVSDKSGLDKSAPIESVDQLPAVEIKDGTTPWEDEITTFYSYYVDKKLMYYVARRGSGNDKWIRPVYLSDEGWVMGSPNLSTLYRSELLHSDERPVIVVEGEKAADAAAMIFKNADVVSWQGGANNYTAGNWSLLSGRKVIIWPDNDVPGIQAAEGIANLLSAKEVYIIDVSSLPAKADLADNLDRQVIIDLYKSAKLVETDYAPGEMNPSLLTTLHSKEIKYITTGWPTLDKHVKLPPTGVVVVSGRTNHGKGQPYDTPILTTSGFKLLRDIRVGDTLASVDGEESIVTELFHHTEVDTYKISFSDGTDTLVWGDHLWEVDNGKGSITVVDTLTIKAGVERGGRRYIPLFKGDFSCGSNPIIHPYLLGALLGDGGLTGAVRFSSGDQFMIDKLQNILGEKYSIIKKSKYDYSIKYTQKSKSNPLLTYVKDYGLDKLSINKSIPEEVFSSDRAYRIAVLQGLMDTDGTVSKQNQVSFGSSSKILFDGFVELARSVGLIVKINRVKQTTHRPHYRCTIAGDVKEIITLPRKLNRLVNRKRNGRKSVVSVEYVGNMDGACIKVSHPRELYITENYIVTHNTALMINLALNIAQKTDKTVLYLTLEFPVEELNLRMIKTLDGKSYSPSGWEDDSIYNTHLAKLSTPAAKTYYNLLISRKLRVADSTITMPELVKIMNKCKDSGKELVVFIDYLQIIPLQDGNKARYEKLKDMIELIRRTANKNSQLLIGGSQLTAGESPLLDQVRESKDLENTAALHLKLWNKQKARDDKEKELYSTIPGDIIVTVEKSRQNGANGKIFGFNLTNGCQMAPAIEVKAEF